MFDERRGGRGTYGNVGLAFNVNKNVVPKIVKLGLINGVLYSVSINPVNKS
jgi:hypothetical protein